MDNKSVGDSGAVKPLCEVAREIILLYESEAPQRTYIDLIQRHGLDMARVLVAIDDKLKTVGHVE